jgi:hypothetical protein
MLPDRPVEARERLEGAIEQARDAIAEGRDAVQGLGSSVVITEDIARAITTLGNALAAEVAGAPFSFTKNTRNLAGLVLLALCETV